MSVSQPDATQLAPVVVADLPADLPPFDLGAALTRMGGRTHLVRKTLFGFNEAFVDTGATFDRLLASRAYGDLERLAHTLKGIAATLDAWALTGAAGALEVALHSSDFSEVSQLVDAVKSELYPALAAAASIGATRTVTPEPPVGEKELDVDAFMSVFE